MRYKVSCYNGDPIFGMDWVFIKPDEVIVEIEAENERDALGEAMKKVDRDYYKVIGVKE